MILLVECTKNQYEKCVGNFPFYDILVNGSIESTSLNYLNGMYLIIGYITKIKTKQLVWIQFKYLCTHNVALIQGPSGTGISYIGVKFVKMLLQNLALRILIMCRTNHLLDAFLESILFSIKEEKMYFINESIDPIRLLRLGGRCKSTKL